MSKLQNDLDFKKRIFDTPSEGVVVQDSQASMIHINKAALAILDLSADALFGKTPQGPRWMAWERALGYLSAELVGKKAARELLDSAEIQAYAAKIEMEFGCQFEDKVRALSCKADLNQECRMEFDDIRKDGSRFPVELSVAAMRGPHAEIIGYISIASDISERKRVEALAFESARRIKQAFEAAPKSHQKIPYLQSVEIGSNRPAWSDPRFS